MWVKALIGFSGKISMHKGEVVDIQGEPEILEELLRAGYVAAEEAKQGSSAEKKKTTRKKAVKDGADK